MTIAELIAHLQTMPQNVQVICRCCSEQVLLEVEQVELGLYCEARPDGWVQDRRDDKPAVQYLCFPGG